LALIEQHDEIYFWIHYHFPIQADHIGHTRKHKDPLIVSKQGNGSTRQQFIKLAFTKDLLLEWGRRDYYFSLIPTIRAVHNRMYIVFQIM